MKRDPRQLRAYELAHDEIGTVEWRDGHNPEVVQYFRDVGHAWVKDDETAWCAAFIGSMIEAAGLPSTRKLNARSYLDWGSPVSTDDARPGDVVVFWRGSRDGWQGHVAFLVNKRGAIWDMLGGNQSNAVNIKGYQTSQILGVRRILSADIPATRPPVPAIGYPDRFEEVMDYTFDHEGGYVDHPSDPGGATNMGITRATLAEWRQRSVSKQDVRNLTKDEARRIYKAKYWDKVRAGEMPVGLDHVLMDASVNSGIGRGPKWLQRALDVTVDGKVGPNTIAAAQASDKSKVINDACDYRMAFLRNLKTWDSFGKGWTRRVEDVRATALRDTARNPATRPSTPPTTPATPQPTGGGFLAFIRAILALFSGGETDTKKRGLLPVQHEGRTIWVTPDYYKAEDGMRMPVGYPSAARIARERGLELPTKGMVDSIYRAADVKLTPQPIPPSKEMTKISVFRQHHDMIERQLRGRTGLIAGHKKDLLRDPARGKVRIYGWHKGIGDVWQPDSNVHEETYADYSHGLRLVYDPEKPA